MPTIWRSGGFRFVIWPEDHSPPHVHVFRAGLEIVVNLETELPYVRDNYGMRQSDERAALLIAALNRQAFLARWKEING